MGKYFLLVIAIYLTFAGDAQTKFKCPLTGLDKHQKVPKKRIADLNRFKNRTAEPDAINSDITLSKVLATGDDRDRFSNEDAASLTGYIVGVKPGGTEDCNCYYGREDFIDTHIEIAVKKGEKDKTKFMVVEMTPRFKKTHADWRTHDIKKLIGSKVTVTGWMLFDENHWQNSRNTNPSGTNLYRATAWEIHPVTAFDVAQ